MRDVLIFAIVFGSLPFILKRPVVGVLMFTWISLMNPHRLAYGAAYDFPFAALVGGITVMSLLFTKEPRRFPITPVTGLLIVFMAWMTLTSFSALEQVLAWNEWNRVAKTFFMTLIAILVIHTKKDIKAYAWVLALSLGFYGLKGGVFTVTSGGTHHVVGPPYTYIGDNNALALALVTALPLIWFMKLQAEKIWMRIGLIGLTLFTAISIIGSYSRGALLGGAAMLFFLWAKSHYKVRTAIAVIVIAPLLFAFIPDKWSSRMDTINNYKEDSSAMGRINSWHFAANVAKDNMLGGGYRVFTPKMFMVYAPEPMTFFDAHSIYFQVLGEHGFIGLTLFLLLMLFAWRTGSRILKFCKHKEDLKWASDLAAMCQASIIGYAVSGAFLTLAYYDLYYGVIALLVLLEKLVLKNQFKSAEADGTIAAPPTSCE